MARFYPTGGSGGGGLDTEECTSTAAQVLVGFTAGVKGGGDKPVMGTMPNMVDGSGGWWTARDAGCDDSTNNATNGLYAYISRLGYYDTSIGIRIPRSLVATRLGIVADKVRAGYSIAGVAGNPYIVWTGDANVAQNHVLKGETFYKNGVKYTGTMEVLSVTSFRAAPYSVDKVVCTWNNPSKGPFGYVCICAKTGGYPANVNEARVYTGIGTNSAPGAQNSMTIGGLAAGQTYYFRIWAGCQCTENGQTIAWMSSASYQQTTAATTAHGEQTFTASGTFYVPAGVRSVDVHCTGGGGCGGVNYEGSHSNYGAAGGSGGRVSYKNAISVSPGESLVVEVGAGSVKTNYTGQDSASSNGGTSSLKRGSSVLCSAIGGGSAYNSRAKGEVAINGGNGGSGGGAGGYTNRSQGASGLDPGVGGSNGSNGNPAKYCNVYYGLGMGSTTYAFGNSSKPLFSGGGGGGGDNYEGWAVGGAGGGGNGGKSYNHPLPTDGSFGTGGGGGGGSYKNDYASSKGVGGSGNVIVRW